MSWGICATCTGPAGALMEVRDDDGILRQMCSTCARRVRAIDLAHQRHAHRGMIRPPPAPPGARIYFLEPDDLAACACGDVTGDPAELVEVDGLWVPRFVFRRAGGAR